MKIAYLGYDFLYKCLDVVLSKGFEVVKIYSFETDDTYNFNTFLKVRAEKNNIPFTTEPISKEDIQWLMFQGCDLLISAAYAYKIPVSESLRGINIHPTLLPVGRGPWPLPHIILNGFKESGITIHKLSEKFDAGDILLQRTFDISEREDLESLSCKCQMHSAEALNDFLKDPETYWRKATPQSGGSYWPMPKDSDRTLVWEKTVEELDVIARAFGKFDAYASFDGKDWIVQDMTVWKESHEKRPGTVVHRTNKEVVIAAVNGFICLRYYSIDPDFE